ncbi:MAG: tRNA (N6-threonylcarbamoyladenosine(37)-N6)-methyltransferase TrmO [bacterium]|nr:tRNA (N6-threonylcarbamoyladenosine(37)-N6)-methyltransferase TrmO [bacterium]
MDNIILKPIGQIESPLKSIKHDGPKMEFVDNAPAAVIHLRKDYEGGLEGLSIGQTIVVITWLHLADRFLLKGHPRGDRSRPERGVFSMRSPARPNPLGIHSVVIDKISENKIFIKSIEVIDGTIVLDIKNSVSK